MDRLLSKDEALDLLLPYVQKNLGTDKSVLVQCADFKLFMDFPLVIVQPGVVTEGGIYVT